MTLEDILEMAEENELPLMVGYEDCICGIGERPGVIFIVYDEEKVIERLINNDGMTREEAEEFCEFNQKSAYVGNSTPAFVTLIDSYKKDGD